MGKYIVEWAIKDRKIDDKGQIEVIATNDREARFVASSKILPQYPLSYWNSFKSIATEVK